ncbi:MULTISPECIES: ATP-grasp domain-containing protein [Xanthomonas]|uniref:ATP-grasp domain-containing protein n=1 Tax=Xanthomonas TaxID=338 RepID=UPI0011155BD8|nr:hypothetical protein [Xanthomonas campestris]MCC5094605.1 hypothetical protein [Xanthomonas campestris pv. incanae]MEA9612626.1 hypothetical protein [Xanthomonas campestris pv. incanae]WDJ08258.1 hypothetical protein JH299_11180 [Xanthomonas campestris pv. incanae]
MITVVSSFLDLHAAAIVWSLSEAGVAAELVETFFGIDQEGAGFTIHSHAFDENQQCVSVDLGRSFSEQQLLYFRGDYTPRVDMIEEEEDFLFVRREKTVHQNWLLQLSVDAGNQTFVNSPCSAIRADNKMLQLKAANEVGLSPPTSYFGSSIDRVKEIFGSTASLVIKPFEPFTWRYADGRTRCAFASRASRSLLDSYEAGTVLAAPAIFQEEISKNFDIRAFVFGKQIHAFKIYQTSGRLDSREDLTDRSITTISKIDLPVEVQEKVGLLMSRMGVEVACMDLVPDKNGVYHFLDLNPSGNWLFLETNVPDSNILSKFCSYLASKAGTLLLQTPPSYADYKASAAFAEMQDRISSLGAKFSTRQRNDQWVEHS